MKSSAAVEMLKALAQESRLEVFRKLAQTCGSVSAGSLSEALDVPANTLSFHLKELVNAGLITATRDGRSILYALAQDNVRDLIAYLCQDCCGGRPELCAIELSVAPPVRAEKSKRSRPK
jgi:ArsR family transcriptional regulator, arsenate/arsenite/antimonite-responsive transcriptional repressor